MATGEDETFPPPSDDGGTDPTTGVGSGEVVVEGFADEESQRSGDVPLLSAPMDQDDHDTDELGSGSTDPEPDEPQLQPAGEDAGFDGWLDDPAQAPERPDPYAELGEDEAADEIADWMAFTQGADDATETESVDEPEPVLEPPTVVRPDAPVEPETVTIVEPPSHIEPAAASIDEDAWGPSAEATEGEAAAETEPFVDDEEEGTVASGVAEDETDAGDARGDEPLELWADDEDDVLPWDQARSLDTDDESGAGDDADTTELMIEGETTVAAVAAGDENDESPSDEPDDTADAASATVFDFEEFTEEQYLQGATSEHAGLAADIAIAATEETQQVALAASMPGVETGVVGFGDVVGTGAGDAVAPPARANSDLAVRVGSAAALIVLLIVSLLWAPVLALLALAVFLLAGWEFYGALISRNYRPISLFGLLGIAGASIGAYFSDSSAVAIALALTIAAALLFDAVAPRRDRPDVNFSLTILVAAWISLGAFAFDIINAEDYRVLVTAVVALVALVDIAQYFAGRSFGRRQLSPVISPKKTVEGLVGGIVTALVLGAALSFFAPFDLGSGLLLGVVVAVFAPLGDLSVSAVKRSLQIKDMGSILPGHGGILDRIDGLMFVIPAAWVAYSWLGLL